MIFVQGRQAVEFVKISNILIFYYNLIKNMNKKKAIVTIVILLLLAGNVFLGTQYFALDQECRQVKASLTTQETNGGILNFTKMFVADVLKAQTEVDFETRLKLENAVREINDPEILSQWQKFTESITEEEAQQEVKNLLEMLIYKIG